MSITRHTRGAHTKTEKMGPHSWEEVKTNKNKKKHRSSVVISVLLEKRHVFFYIQVILFTCFSNPPPISGSLKKNVGKLFLVLYPGDTGIGFPYT